MHHCRILGGGWASFRCAWLTPCRFACHCNTHGCTVSERTAKEVRQFSEFSLWDPHLWSSIADSHNIECTWLEAMILSVPHREFCKSFFKFFNGLVLSLSGQNCSKNMILRVLISDSYCCFWLTFCRSEKTPPPPLPNNVMLSQSCTATWWKHGTRHYCLPMMPVRLSCVLMTFESKELSVPPFQRFAWHCLKNGGHNEAPFNQTTSCRHPKHGQPLHVATNTRAKFLSTFSKIWHLTALAYRVVSNTLRFVIQTLLQTQGREQSPA